MFTGIVEMTGRVVGLVRRERALRLQVEAPGMAGSLSVGDSLCVCGVCLTVVQRSGDRLEFDVVEETLQRSTLGGLEPGARVNLERPLSLTTFLGGHLVQGHVDAVGEVKEVERRGEELWVTISAPPGVLRYVVEKGSIAVEGVSLTVAALTDSSFSVALIPHTAEVTTLGECRPGSRVNLEADLLAKHLERLAAPYMERLADAIRSH